MVCKQFEQFWRSRDGFIQRVVRFRRSTKLPERCRKPSLCKKYPEMALTQANNLCHCLARRLESSERYSNTPIQKIHSHVSGSCG